MILVSSLIFAKHFTVPQILHVLTKDLDSKKFAKNGDMSSNSKTSSKRCYIPDYSIFFYILFKESGKIYNKIG